MFCAWVLWFGNVGNFNMFLVMSIRNLKRSKYMLKLCCRLFVRLWAQAGYTSLREFNHQ